MPKFLTAIYEDGVLKPLVPLALTEHQRVSVTIADLPGPDDDVLDHEFLSSLEEEELREVTLEEVQRALSKIPGSMTPDFIAEREERF